MPSSNAISYWALASSRSTSSPRPNRALSPRAAADKILNYILRLLYMGCQWKELPIEKDGEGRPEIHHTRIYSAFRRWDADGCMDAIFTGSVLRLHQDNLLDITVIHGDGTTTAAKKGDDNIGFSGHKKVKDFQPFWPSGVQLCHRSTKGDWVPAQF